MTTRLVAVPVSTLWSAPDAPRDVDRAIVADLPEVGAWLRDLAADADGHRGLQGLILTQVVAGEPVTVIDDTTPGWLEVVCPWQPSHTDSRGYRGWLPAAHVTDLLVDLTDLPVPSVPRAPRAPSAHNAHNDSNEPCGELVHPAVAGAREYLGLAYLWGGMSPAGFDCSGLVHWQWRARGVVIPRDADDQQESAEPVELDAVRPGDLYFFARPGASIHHVGIVTAPGRMIHAPETGSGVREESVAGERLATLSAAGRFDIG